MTALGGRDETCYSQDPIRIKSKERKTDAAANNGCSLVVMVNSRINHLLDLVFRGVSHLRVSSVPGGIGVGRGFHFVGVCRRPSGVGHVAAAGGPSF